MGKQGWPTSDYIIFPVRFSRRFSKVKFHLYILANNA